MKLLKNSYTKLGLGLAAGAILGYAYYYFIGCNTGTCPITSSPVISTVYGGIMGALIAFPNINNRKKDEE